ncbi:carbohydrate kinase [Roseibium sp. CAU 1637]|uniref:Carbohydrate kinase n=1 Tax=Roseibium limicola TaxID=2816037 RepID=A0A939EQV5_9HYPH|nr:carbohydrate kinase [Roseibium limicola]
MADNKTYLLGLDAGNTVIKAVLFDLEGKVVAMHALDGQSSSPSPGYVERDLNELWANAEVAIRTCLQEAGVAPSDIAAIGCAGHGNGLYLIDADGIPLIGIQSLDSRAADLADELAKRHGAAFHSICLQKPWPSQTPVLLAWVKQHQPELYARTATVMLCKDFINFKLTGARTSDLSDMSGCGLLRMPECDYDDDLLSLYGLADARDLMPELINPTDLCGHVNAAAARTTGLAEGTPVIGGYFDVVASAMGSGVVSPGEASIIVGTWSINQVFSERPVENQDVFMAAGFGPGRFVNIESSATSAGNLEWYVREFIERGGHHEDPFGYCNDQVATVTPALDDPMFHPFLYGSRQGSEFRAGYYGVAGWHGEGHLLRALFEGVMFEHRRHVEVLRNTGVRFETAALSGGGSRSPIWPQMFADGLNVPMRVADAHETGALGAAIGAGVGAGLFDSYETGIQVMTRVRAQFVPDIQMIDYYNTRYAHYLALRDAMRFLWSASCEF